MVDASGTNAYAYTAGGFLWTEDGPWSSDTVTNTYNNRLRTGLDVAQPTGKWTNSFGYDAAKRLTGVTSPAGTFSYLFSGVALHASRITLPNSSYITNTYDTMARLKGTYLKTSGHVVTNKHEYNYNAGHQRTQQIFLDASTYDYTYDKIGQLKVADSSVAAQDRGYAYDSAWNLNYRTNDGTLQTFKVDGLNQLTNAPNPTSTNTYDGNGNLITAKSSSTSNYRYCYDDENRLVRWIFSRNAIGCDDAASNNNDQRTDFVYDGQGRLRVRTEYDGIKATGGWVTNTEVRYLYDGMRVNQERSSANTPTVSYTRGTDLSGSLEGAGGIGGLLGRSHAYQSASGNWTNHNYYHADGNGNVTYMLNSSQSKVAEYRYDPFGNTISSSGTLAAANVYRFSSKEIHVNSGLYYYGYRFYHPNLQRWLNRDPLGELGAINLHGYVDNNSINSIDPFGLSAVDDVRKALRSFEKGLCGAISGGFWSWYYFEKKAPGKTRYAHCMVSCQIADNCRKDAAIAAGVAKEFYDLAKCVAQGLRRGKWDSPQCESAFQPSDFKDNAQGINCPNDKSCAEQCQDLKNKGEAAPGPFFKLNEKDLTIIIF